MPDRQLLRWWPAVTANQRALGPQWLRSLRPLWFVYAALILSSGHVLGAPAPAGASFDCSKPRSAVESLICADPELTQLDADYAAKFARTGGGGVKSAWIEAHAEWRWREANCRTKKCLVDWYGRRNEALDGPNESRRKSDARARVASGRKSVGTVLKDLGFEADVAVTPERFMQEFAKQQPDLTTFSDGWHRSSMDLKLESCSFGRGCRLACNWAQTGTLKHCTISYDWSDLDALRTTLKGLYGPPSEGHHGLLSWKAAGITIKERSAPEGSTVTQTLDIGQDD